MFSLSRRFQRSRHVSHGLDLGLADPTRLCLRLETFLIPSSVSCTSYLNRRYRKVITGQSIVKFCLKKMTRVLPLVHLNRRHRAPATDRGEDLRKVRMVFENIRRASLHLLRISQH